MLVVCISGVSGNYCLMYRSLWPGTLFTFDLCYPQQYMESKRLLLFGSDSSGMYQTLLSISMASVGQGNNKSFTGSKYCPCAFPSLHLFKCARSSVVYVGICTSLLLGSF